MKRNESRFFYLSREAAEKVLEACPDAQWRLLFARSRFGALRCPSEHLSRRWGDVDWANNRIRVPSPKAEHHEGRASRWIPLFPELRPHLEAVFEAAEPGTEYVITRYRSANANLRTQFERIIRRAGLEPITQALPEPSEHARNRAGRRLSDPCRLRVGGQHAGRGDQALPASDR
ncbi:MAG TPA: hypothetical protein VIK18_00570 [Pirellulales bacterium]